MPCHLCRISTLTSINAETSDLQHAVMGVTLSGNHCLCPKNNGAKRVLDLGTGSGIWAIEYGELSGMVTLPGAKY